MKILNRINLAGYTTSVCISSKRVHVILIHSSLWMYYSKRWIGHNSLQGSARWRLTFHAPLTTTSALTHLMLVPRVVP